MPPEDKIFLLHIIESIKIIESHIKNISEEKFSRSRIIQDAIVRRLEVVGEAARNLSVDFKKKHNQIEWPKITGMRNLLIHEYFGVDLMLVWKTVKNDLPTLKKEIKKFFNILVYD